MFSHNTPMTRGSGGAAVALAFAVLAIELTGCPPLVAASSSEHAARRDSEWNGSAAGTSNSIPPLQVLTYGTSANGFSSVARGWSPWGLLANQRINQTQAAVLRQCSELRARSVRTAVDINPTMFDTGELQPPPELHEGHTAAGFPDAGFAHGPADTVQYCVLDSGWSAGCNGDAFGRPMPDLTVFPDMAGLATELSADTGPLLGVYLLPGTFNADRLKLIRGTNITLGSTWKHGNTGKFSKFCRMEFNFSSQGVQEWHNSVVDTLCEDYGVRYIKLDYVCPTSSPDGCEGFPDSRLAATAYHTAVGQSKCNGTMRVGLSWMLDWSAEYWPTWSADADAMRLDEDINNRGQRTLVQFGTVQRAIERYRVFVTSLAQGLVPLRIRPDLDSTFVANPERISGLNDAQRSTMALHWIAAGANLLEGGDLTQIDPLGRQLLFDPALRAVAAQFNDHPMQPRNPRSEPWCQPPWPWTAGGTNPQQLQTWIVGPNARGDALVLLANLGPDEHPRTGPSKSGTFRTECNGTRRVLISLTELGLPVRSIYSTAVVWDGRNGTWRVRTANGRREQHRVLGDTQAAPELAADLAPWESILYKLTRVSS
eukprot:m.20943 g.20943  ORF g.20943 m.20943 type:complete len:598 (+) comp10342_c0_seq1:35-1828(+)